MSVKGTDQVSTVGYQRSRKLKTALLLKWSSTWEFLYRSLAYIFTLETLLCNHKMGDWDEESTCVQIAIIYVFIGLPLYYTQIVIGQYAQTGIMCYKNILPIARGLSWTILICVVLQTLKYGIWLGDSMLYFLASMQKNLPWMYCPENTTLLANNISICFDDKVAPYCDEDECLGPHTQISSRYYHMRTFLGVNEDMENKTLYPPSNRTVALCAAWFLIFLFVYKVFLKFRKVLLIQAVLGCALVLMLCTGTISASGGKSGITFLFKDMWLGVAYIRTWTRAISTVITGLCLGQAFAMSSGAKFSTKQSIITMLISIAAVKAVVSLFCSIFYQSIIGMIAVRTKTSLDRTAIIQLPFDFLAFFVTIPQGLGYLTVPQVWSMLYFSFCITILLMNIISRVAVIWVVIGDVYNFIIKYGKYLFATYCIFAFIVGIIMIGERHYLYSCYFMSRAITLLEVFNVTYMALMIFYVYGVTKLSDDIQFLTGTPPTKFWKVSWYCLPVIMAYTFYEEYIYFLEEKNHGSEDKILIHISLIICILPIPIYWIVESISHVKTRHLTGMFRSTQSWGPADPEERHKRLSFNPRLQTKYHSRSTACNHHCFVTYKGLRILQQEESRITDAFLAEFEDQTVVKKESRRKGVRKTIALDILDEKQTMDT